MSCDADGRPNRSYPSGECGHVHVDDGTVHPGMSGGDSCIDNANK